jgi:hypothetical protein
MRGGRALLALALLLVLLAACGRASLRETLDRGSVGDADLVAVLPKGLDAVLDVDVADLRRLDSAAAILAYLPTRALGPLANLVDLPLRDLDALAVGLRSVGTSEHDFVLVARGRIERARVVKTVRALGEVREVEYHGVPLVENLGDGPGALAAAQLTPRTVALANRYAVRQVIDIYRGADDGARQQGDLMAALSRAPRAKVGRPAILLAMLMTPPLRERLRAAELPELGADAEMIAVALAVGDGFDLGLVAGYAELGTAKDVAARLLDRAQLLRQRPALAFLGAARYIEPLVAVGVDKNPAKGRNTPELHVAYRLSGDDVHALLDRIHKLEELRDKLPGG